jgi:hypothetical protein
MVSQHTHNGSPVSSFKAEITKTEYERLLSGDVDLIEEIHYRDRD